MAAPTRLPLVFIPLQSLLQEYQIDEILQTNALSAQYGLTLTASEARDIIETRNILLQSYGRLELDTAVARKIIDSFSVSPYIAPEDYGATIKELQEIFYYLKNETADQVSDDELIALLQDSFDNTCRGSLELLQGSVIDTLAGMLKRNQLEHAQADYRSWKGEDDQW